MITLAEQCMGALQLKQKVVHYYKLNGMQHYWKYKKNIAN
jgi:hypothetical protein